MVGDKLEAETPYMQERRSPYGEAPSHVNMKPYTMGQPKNKFISDIENAAYQGEDKTMFSNNSKEMIGENGTAVPDTLRLSLKSSKKPIMLVEQNIRSGHKERLDSATKGKSYRNMSLMLSG